MTFTIAPCSAKAARYAVERWHYSKTMPLGRLARYGVWENDRYIGVILFGRGASPNLYRFFDLDEHTQCAELVRIALTRHEAPVTQYVAEALRRLHEDSPGLRVVASFADAAQGHLGKIYQAGNWTYLGTTTPDVQFYIGGTWKHRREWRGVGFQPDDGKAGWVHNRQVMGQSFGRTVKPDEPLEHLGLQVSRSGLPTRRIPGKFRYAYPLDRRMRKWLRAHAEPYPTAGTLRDLLEKIEPDLPATSSLADEIRAQLTPDLLTPDRRRLAVSKPPTWGHCYVATETAWWLLGGPDSGYRAKRTKHEGDTHWWLEAPDGTVLDVTADQFETPVPYEQGIGAAFLTKKPSKRCRLLLSRIGSAAQVSGERRRPTRSEGEGQSLGAALDLME